MHMCSLLPVACKVAGSFRRCGFASGVFDGERARPADLWALVQLDARLRGGVIAIA
jgi:hypothetical protein